MRTLLLGVDAVDTQVFEQLSEQGVLPNLEKYVRAGQYAHLQVVHPPQSEVSWTSIASGLNPGQHGLFDFVHRDPASYALYVSLLPTKKSRLGTQFVRPFAGKTMFDTVAERGYPAKMLWWPGTFPARPGSPVWTLPGLGTPDVRGRLGIGTLFTTDPGLSPKLGKTPVQVLKQLGRDRYSQELPGPAKGGQTANQTLELPFQLEIEDDWHARLSFEGLSLELVLGEWSPILELDFPVWRYLFSIGGVTRVILTQIKPEIRLYFLPIQIHPLKSAWRYGTPGGFIKSTWRNFGPFLTLGWPQDTTGLEDGILTEEQFLYLCEAIHNERVGVFISQLTHFKEGLLGVVFDTLDRIQHMFWRSRPDVVEKWYGKVDSLVGLTQEFMPSRQNNDDHLVVVSDHGFTNFNYKVHLNRWLIDNGYLVPKEPVAQGDWHDIDWSRTRAYAIGLNSLYLNLAGREGQGQVLPDERERLLSELSARLVSYRDPDGSPVFRDVWRNREVFSGPLSERGPDLVTGYAPGYRASSRTGLGGWREAVVTVNNDHWNGDHCIDPQMVPGVLFSSRGLENFPSPSYRDMPYLILDEAPEQGDQPPPALEQPLEDDDVMEERLKSLGYL